MRTHRILPLGLTVLCTCIVADLDDPADWPDVDPDAPAIDMLTPDEGIPDAPKDLQETGMDQGPETADPGTPWDDGDMDTLDMGPDEGDLADTGDELPESMDVPDDPVADNTEIDVLTGEIADLPDPVADVAEVLETDAGPCGEDCDDENLCTIDYCDLENGQCVHEPMECDDNDVCNGSESCNPATGCEQGTPMSCVDADVCNGLESCDPILGCQPGDKLNCNDGSDCTLDTCDSALGCLYESDNEGGGCLSPGGDDGTCIDGVCTPECTVESGCDDGIDCTDDVCNEVSLKCEFTPDDGACDDQNDCTDNACNPASGCVVNFNELDCDDGDACTSNDKCHQGLCSPGEALICDDGDLCNGLETCDPLEGCVEGTPLECNDGDYCNGQEMCHSTTGCGTGIPLACDDGNTCNGQETCVPETGCQQGIPPVCDDGDICNGLETCDPATGCLEGTDLQCDDNNVCNGLETCDPEKGCQAGTLLDCDDDDPCNGEETCDGMTGCVAGTDLDCDDQNPCTADECTEMVGCQHTSTNEGLACKTINDKDGTCISGICQPPCTEDGDCDDGIACTVDSCDKDALKCVFAPEHVTCNDGNPCNGAETCDPVQGCLQGVALECDDANPDKWDGCTDCLVSEIRVNTTLAGSQSDPAVATLSNGDFMVVWTAFNGQENGIYGRRFTPLGVPLGSEFQVDQHPDTVNLKNPDVAGLAGGGFGASWQVDGDGTEIRAILFDAVGEALGMDIQVNGVNQVSFQDDPSVAAVGEGLFLVWSSQHTGSNNQIQGRYMGPDMAFLTSEFQVNTDTSDNRKPWVAATGLGHHLVLYGSNQDNPGSQDYGVWAQAFQGTGGLAVGPEFRVNAYTEEFQENPSADFGSHGSGMAAWTSGWTQEGDASMGIYARRLGPGGTVIDVEDVHVNKTIAGDQYDPRVAALEDGRFVVGWNCPTFDGSGMGVVLRMVKANGLFASDEFGANTHTAGDQAIGDMAALPDGKFVVVWGSDGQDEAEGGVFLQVFWPDGARVYAPEGDGDDVPADGDGSGTPGDNPCPDGQATDCDDNCAGIANPGQANLDQDALGDECDPDDDGDGDPDATDCAPLDPSIGHQAEETCNGVDDDCDGSIDENGESLCTDEDACNGIESCEGQDGCQAGSPPDCNDANVCTDDSCDTGSGCVNVDNTVDCAAAYCDGLFFYDVVACLGGVCPAQTSVNCDDSNECTDDSCGPATGCLNTDNTVECAAPYCDDLLFYDAVDCVDWACPPQTPTDCNDSDLCTTDACDEADGCVYQDVDCDDQDPCTLNLCVPDSGCDNPLDPNDNLETCNGADDNCNGQTDTEDPDLLADDLQLCENQQGVCNMADKPVSLCSQGAWQDCTVLDYTEHGQGDYQDGQETACDNKDNDCDGLTDALDPDLEQAEAQLCEVQVGVCNSAEKPVALCESGTWQACTTDEYLANDLAYEAGTETQCDDKDNDCDGDTDEHFAITDWNGGNPVVGHGCGTGECAGGTVVCDGATAAICSTAGNSSAETCDGKDNDCDGATDEDDATGCTVYFKDSDDDTWGLTGDSQCKCAPAAPYDTVQEGDCKDTNDAINPDAIEVCDNLVDENCNGQTDEAGCQGCIDYYLDLDDDTWGVTGDTQCLSAPSGDHTATRGQDCDDGDATVNPGLSESCTGKDDDCDGNTDTGLTAPACALQNGVCGGSVRTCGGAQGWLDCTDTNYGGDYEAGTETTCDGKDNDCDDSTDEDLNAPVCPLQLGVCTGSVQDCDGASGWQDCTAANYGGDYESGTEATCDGKDNDCDGDTDEHFAVTDWDGSNPVVGEGCGTGACAGGTVECDGTTAAVCSSSGSSTTEICDGVDNDCDGQTDEDLTPPPCPVQIGVCAGSVKICGGVAGWQDCVAANYGGDYQAGTETTCDGKDNDCDGPVDEHFAITDWDGSNPVVGEGCGTGECIGGTVVCDGATAAVCDTLVQSASEFCDGKDNDCNGNTDEDLVAPLCTLQDGVCAGAAKTCGGVAGWQDCTALDYLDHNIDYEDGAEATCDGKDNDCDDDIDEHFAVTDWDGSNPVVGEGCGTGACDGGMVECDTSTTAVCDTAGSSTTESCDGSDNDCDGATDEDDATNCTMYYRDNDDDTYGLAGDTQCKCAAADPYDAIQGGDCKDTNDAINPDAIEVCNNGVDEDCNGQTDEAGCQGCIIYYLDVDDDTWGVTGDTQCLSAASGDYTATRGQDCADGDATVNPGVQESCTGKDDDCDGNTDTGLTPPPCPMQNGVCAGSVKNCGGVAGWLDCTAADYGGDYEVGAETTCDGKDNDCDDSTDEHFSIVDWNGGTPAVGEGCGTGECAGGTVVCYSTTVAVCDTAGSSAAEGCDNQDNDCDGSTDEDLTAPACAEQDGVCLGSVKVCGGASGWLDCEAANYGIFYEDGENTCDGRDNDCDGLTDAADDELGTVWAPACGQQSGVCAGLDKPASLCVGGEWQPCTDTEYGNYSADYEAGTETKCDNLDNDCDGNTDADDGDLEAAAPDCTLQDGVCAGSTKACGGVQGWLACTALDYLAHDGTFEDGTESQCDTRDNDCDNDTDEHFTITDWDGSTPVVGDGCGTGDCAGGTVVCGTTTTAVCNTAGSSTSETCDSADNDCDGDTDECQVASQQCLGGECRECWDSNAVDWDGCTNDVPTEFRVNTWTAGSQADSVVATIPDGRFMVAWTGAGQDGEGNGVFGQRYRADGSPDGTEFPVNTWTTGDQEEPAIAAFPDGRYVVSWTSAEQDGDVFGIFAKIYDPYGVPLDSEFQVNTATYVNQYQGSVATHSDGRFVLVWTDESVAALSGQMFDSVGTADGTEFLVNTYSTNWQTHPKVATLSNGGFVVVWEDWVLDGDERGIFGQMFQADGDMDGGWFQVNTYTTGFQYQPSVAGFDGGGFAVTWSDSSKDADAYGVFAQRYDNAGSPVGGEFQVNSYTFANQDEPHVASFPSGSFAVGFASYAPGGQAATARLFDALGAPEADQFQANVFTSNPHSGAKVGPFADGGFVLVWDSPDQDGDSTGVYARLYDSDGNPVLNQDGDTDGQTNFPDNDDDGDGSVDGVDCDDFDPASFPGGVEVCDGHDNDCNLTVDDGFTDTDSDGIADCVDWDGDDDGEPDLSDCAPLDDTVNSSASEICNDKDDDCDGDTDECPGATQQCLGGACRECWDDNAVDWDGCTGDEITEFMVNVYSTDNQHRPEIVGLSNGRLVVVWSGWDQDGDSLGVFGRVMEQDGSFVTGDLTLNEWTTSWQYHPRVDAFSDNRFVVTWSSDAQDAGSTATMARVFDGNGAALSNEIVVNSDTNGIDAYANTLSDVAALSDGTFVVAWNVAYTTGGSGDDFFARRFRSDGTPIDAADFLVHDYTTNGQRDPALEALPGGGFVVVWEDAEQDGNGKGVYHKRYDASGIDLSGDVLVNVWTTRNQQDPRIAVMADGSYVVTWEGDRETSGSAVYEIWARRFASDGTAVDAADIWVNAWTSGWSIDPRIVALDGGSFAVGWTQTCDYTSGDCSVQDGDGWGAVARVFGSDGSPHTGDLLVNSYTTSTQRYLSLAETADGRLAVAFESNATILGGQGTEIFASLFSLPDGDRLPPMDGDGDGLTNDPDTDDDGDGDPDGTDCDDLDPDSHASGTEVCDGHDNDCNGTTDDTFTDTDTDGTADCVDWDDDGDGDPDLSDCATLDNAVYWGATETCNSVDDNCDGATDEGSGLCTLPQQCLDGTCRECWDDNAVDWDGCTNGEITEFQVNTYTWSHQLDPSVATFDDDGFVVAWSSAGQDDPSYYGIFGQRYLPDGTPEGSEFQVNTYTTESQASPAVATFSDGRFVVVWRSVGQDGDLDGIFGQQFLADGTPDGAEFPVNTYTTSIQYDPSVASFPDDRFVVAWHSFDQIGAGYDVFAQTYLSSGSQDGSEFQVNTYTTNGQFYPVVATKTDGGFLIAWFSWWQDGSDDGVVGQRFLANGTPDGSEFPINSYTTGDQNYPSVATFADDAFVVVWQSTDQDGEDNGIFGQRFLSSGTADGSEFPVNTYTTGSQESPAVAAFSNGQFVVTWASVAQDGSNSGIFGQRFLANGTPEGDEFQVNTYTTNDQTYPAMAVGSSRLVVSWRSEGQDGQQAGIFARRYDTDGTPILNMDGDGDGQTNGPDPDDDGDGSSDDVDCDDFDPTSYPGGTEVCDGSDNDCNGDTDEGSLCAAPEFCWEGTCRECWDDNAVDWDGCNNGIMAEIKASVPDDGVQAAVDVAVLQDDRFVIVWHDDTHEGDSEGIFGRRYGADGTALAGPVQLNAFTTGKQASPYLRVLPDGRFVAAWTNYDGHFDGDARGVTARILDPDLGGLTGDLPVNVTTTGDQFTEAVDSLSVLTSGRFIVSWQGDSDADGGYGAIGRLYSTTGTALSGEMVLPSLTTYTEHQPSTAALPGGGFVTAFTTGGMEIQYRRFDADGAPVDPLEVAVNVYTTNTQWQPTVDAFADGGFVVGWIGHNQEATPDYDVFVRRFTSGGSAVDASDVLVNQTTDYNQGWVDVAVLTGGGFVVAWESVVNGSGTDLDALGRVYDASGNPVTDEFQLGILTADYQRFPMVAARSDGGFVAAWSAKDNNWDIFFRIFDASGNPVRMLDPDGDGLSNEVDTDDDGDGDPDSTDCDDLDPDSHASGTEVCDGHDNDCDGTTDNGETDTDTDGTADCVDWDDDGDGDPDLSDCAPLDDAIYTGATETCNDVDDDCDGETDDGCDDDEDGHCDELMVIVGSPAICPNGTEDCNDDNNAINPTATDVCEDLIDQDCDQIDLECPICQHFPTGAFQIAEEWYWGELTSDKTDCEDDVESGGYLQVSSVAIVANLTDDDSSGVIDSADIPEIIFPAYKYSSQYKERGRLTAIHGDTGNLLWQVSDSAQLVASTSTIAVGDIDNDGLPEIVAQLSTHYSADGLIAFTNTGTEFWKNTDSSVQWGINSGSVAIANLDHQGTPEVIYGRTVFAGDTGQTLAKGTSSTLGANQGLGSIPCIADIVPGGNMEVVVGPVLYTYADDPAPELQFVWQATYQGSTNVPDGFCAVANMDGTTGPEIVLAAEGKVFIIDDDGAVLDWVDAASVTGHADQGRLGSPLVEDFDNDGDLEIGVAGKVSYFVLENDLSLKWQYATEDDASSGTGSTAFDLQGDGGIGILHNDEFYLRILDGVTGDLLAEVLNSSRTRMKYPVVADVDRDGYSEIIFPHNNEASYLLEGGKPPTSGCGIRVWGIADRQWVNAPTIWNQHTYHVTNVSADGSIPVTEQDSWNVYNNYRVNELGSGKFYAPDLGIIDISIPSFTCGDPLSVEFLIRNKGSAIVASGVPVTVYGDGTPVSTTFSTESLFPDDMETIVVQIDPAPSNGTAISVVLDDDGTGSGIHVECDESNNQIGGGTINCVP